MDPVIADFGLGEAIVTALTIFLPVVTALAHLIFRGSGMRERAIKEQAEVRREAESYIRDVASSSPSSRTCATAA